MLTASCATVFAIFQLELVPHELEQVYFVMLLVAPSSTSTKDITSLESIDVVNRSPEMPIEL